MQTRQDTICFPFRKTRSSRTNPEKPVISTVTNGLDATCCTKIELDSSQKCSCKGEKPSKVSNKFCSPRRSSRKTEILSRTTDVAVSPHASLEKVDTSSKASDIPNSPWRSSQNNDTQSKPSICSNPQKSSDTTSLSSKLTIGNFYIEKSSCRLETLTDFKNLQRSPPKIYQQSASSTIQNEEGEADENQVTPRKQRIIPQGMEDGLSPLKRPVVVLNKLVLESPKLASKACRRLMSDPTILEDSHSPSLPREAMQNLPLSPNKFSSPQKFSTGIEPKIRLQTPQKSSLSSLTGMEDGPSPSKRPVVVLNKLFLESPKLTSKARRRLISDPTIVEDSHLLSSPRQAIQSLPLSPNKFSSPQKFCTHIEPRITRLQSPQKSSSSSLTDISSTDCANEKVIQSTSRCPVRNLHLNSPVKNSPPKQTYLNFAKKSPLKRLDVGSPRRSPCKFNQENRCSPRRSPRKLPQSPMQFSSPSSLVSRLSLTSPTSTKNKAVGLFKPDVTPYCALRQSLNTGAPTVLICREKQVSEMQEFLTHHITTAKPGSLYISGAPGTGKTASLNSIMDNLKANKIKSVFLNCMTLKTSVAIYRAIVSELGLKVCGTERENLRIIEKAITTSKCPILIMLDEVDQLDSKNQEVLYTIFEWPALAGSTLVLVGIANSLDLTDRILPRLQARPTFKPKLLHFPPYTKAEIVRIISQRIQEAGLGDLQIIRPAAIQLVAGKVASVAGDARKALDVCRRAVESCEIQARRQSVLKPSNESPRKSPRKHHENGRLKMVEVHQVLSIFNEIYGSRVISAVRDAPESFPLQQKVLICCFLLILKHARSKDVTLGKFHEVYTRICKKRQIPSMDQSEFLSMCTLLESRGMLQVKSAKEIRSSKVILRLNAEEAEQTLGDRILLANILEDRESLGKMCKA